MTKSFFIINFFPCWIKVVYTHHLLYWRLVEQVEAESILPKGTLQCCWWGPLHNPFVYFRDQMYMWQGKKLWRILQLLDGSDIPLVLLRRWFKQSALSWSSEVKWFRSLLDQTHGCVQRYALIITADMLYSGHHDIADTLLRKVWYTMLVNSLEDKHLYSGHHSIGDTKL